MTTAELKFNEFKRVDGAIRACNFITVTPKNRIF